MAYVYCILGIFRLTEFCKMEISKVSQNIFANDQHGQEERYGIATLIVN